MTQLYTGSQSYMPSSYRDDKKPADQGQSQAKSTPKSPYNINISQILVDFKNTIASIGASPEIEQKVKEYISMVEIESNQEAPRKETIISYLKTASKLLDDYISETLKKPSNVVQDWIDAFLLQEVDYKADAEKAAVSASKQIEAQMDPELKTRLDNQSNSTSAASAVANYNNYQNQIHSRKNVQQPQQKLPAPAQSSQQQSPLAPQVEQSQEEKKPKRKAKFVGADGKIHQGDKIIGEKTKDGSTVIYSPEESAQKTLEAQEAATEQKPSEKFLEEAKKPRIRQPQPQQASNSEPKEDAISQNLMIQNFYEKAKQYLDDGDAQKALDSYKKTLEYAKRANDKEAQAYIIQGIGESYDDMNNLARAAKCFNRAVKTTKDLNLKATGHNSLGEIYDESGKFDLAMDHYFESLALNGETDNTAKQAQTLNTIGKMHTSRYMSKEAIDFYKLALDMAKQNTPDIATMGSVLNNTADAFKMMNKPQSALKYYQKSITCANKASDKQTASEAYEKAADLMMDMKKPQKAYGLYKRAMQEALNSKDTEQIRNLKEKMNSIGVS